MATAARRVLLIAYQFPPVGGAGVQRVAKLCKYLPRQAWAVSVLTVSNPSVPLVDNSLCADIPAETLVRKAASWEPSYRLKDSLSQSAQGNAARGGWLKAAKQAARQAAMQLLQPDPQILWAPAAIRAGTRLLREVPHSAILVSGPPFSSFLIGASLSRRSGLPLLLDFRDEWSISNRYWENKPHNRWTDFLQRRLQRVALRRARTLIATTELSAATLRQEAAQLGRSPDVRCIYNGFDPADLPPATGAVQRDANRYRVSHIGTLWRLTSARPLLEAVERLANLRPDLAARLDVELVGRCTAAEEPVLDSFRALPCRLLRQEYLDHTDAVQLMRDAHELCLLLSEVPGAERVVPGKTFEYLATGNRVLTIAPEGELRNIVAQFPGVSAWSPSDVSGIAQHLAEAIESAPSRVAEQLVPRNLARFDRREQAGEMADALNHAVGQVAGQALNS